MKFINFLLLINFLKVYFLFDVSLFESEVPVLYENTNNTESLVHKNRVFTCRDHAKVEKNICSRAKTHACFCEEHEKYTFSFCRHSCGYCKQEDLVTKPTWRIKPIDHTDQPLEIEEIIFYFSPFNTTPASIPYSFKLKNESYKFKWISPVFKNKLKNEGNYISYVFNVPVLIDAVKIKQTSSSPHRYFSIDASFDKMAKKNFTRRWIARIEQPAAKNIYYHQYCPVLWKKYDALDSAYCFKMFASYEGWDKAKKECEINGGNLATIRNKNENNFIIKNLKPCGNVWIGFNDKSVEGKYEWIDGYKNEEEQLFSNWSLDDVKSIGEQNDEDCVYLDREGKWHTDLCDNKHYILCRKKIENILDIDIDYNNPNIEPPLLFFASDFSLPVLNNTRTTMLKEKESDYFNQELYDLSKTHKRSSSSKLKAPNNKTLNKIKPNYGTYKKNG